MTFAELRSNAYSQIANAKGELTSFRFTREDIRSVFASEDFTDLTNDQLERTRIQDLPVHYLD